jgi:DNA (cytosine-5)-methyltransferase 1
VSLTIGSLFSGIGGLELGLERAGLGPVVWQVEREPYCRAVLAKHWPDAARHDDVCAVGAHTLTPVDVICGGFPCQDVSYAGEGAGIAEGTRSGLWFEYARLVRELRPRYVVVENVAALLTRGLGVVLGDLARLGYDAEWSTVSACSVGAPHVRQRVFVVAYPDGQHGRPGLRYPAARPNGPLQAVDSLEGARARYRARLADPSALYRGADGVPHRLERNRAIGNAVAPDVGTAIGRLIVARERALALEASDAA